MDVSDTGNQLGLGALLFTMLAAVLTLVVTCVDYKAPAARRALELCILGCTIVGGVLLFSDSKLVHASLAEMSGTIIVLQTQARFKDDQAKSQIKQIVELQRKVALQDRVLRDHDIKINDITGQITVTKRAVVSEAVTKQILGASEHDQIIYHFLRESSGIKLMDIAACRAQDVIGFRYVVHTRNGTSGRPRCIRPALAQDFLDAHDVRWLVVPFSEGGEAVKSAQANRMLVFTYAVESFDLLKTLPSGDEPPVGVGFDSFGGNLRSWNISAQGEMTTSSPPQYLTPRYRVQLWRYGKQGEMQETGEYCSEDASGWASHILVGIFGGRPAPIEDPPYGVDLKTPKSCRRDSPPSRSTST